MNNKKKLLDWVKISVTDDGVASTNPEDVIRCVQVQEFLKEIEKFDKQLRQKPIKKS